MKRFFSFLIALTLFLSLFVCTVFAEEIPEDLTGYTFIFDEEILASPVIDAITYDLNFISNGFEFSYITVNTFHLSYVDYDEVHIFDDGLLVADDAFRTIQILGGLDSTNSELIEFLLSNGTFLKAPPVDNSIYGQIFNTINELVFGNSEVGTAPYLACTLLSLIACILLIALPFLIVFKIISMIGGY